MMLGNYGKMTKAITEATTSAWCIVQKSEQLFTNEGGWEAFRLSVSEGQWAR
jgi:hypothetical protein